jgi:hypothetical protein
MRGSLGGEIKPSARLFMRQARNRLEHDLNWNIRFPTAPESQVQPSAFRLASKDGTKCCHRDTSTNRSFDVSYRDGVQVQHAF